ncbi:MAG TPA: helix-turn-helix domain-containing protein [Vicinamibacterales bacterium]|nr:helix-turn-helix domain-containing protein [Vicinamibacterales bacterium]HPW21350.1 helix-turn-helix domain-containing protein [Vicinamibacterales bacterium]
MKPSPPAPDSRTRERLLDAAERLFASRGFPGAFVREITEAAGANLGAVNYHFRSKAGLYAEVFARRAALLRAPVLAAARDAAAHARRDPDRAFRALGRAFLAPHADRRASVRVFELLAREVVDRCLPRRHFAERFVVPALDAIASVVREVRPDLPDHVGQACAHAFFVQLMAVVKAAATSGKSIDERLDEAVRFTVAAVLHIDAGLPTRPRSAAARDRS